MGIFLKWLENQTVNDFSSKATQPQGMDFPNSPGPLQGLEGPFRFASGKVLYYDPKEGKYYDRSTDMYVDNEEMQHYLYPQTRSTLP